MFRYISPMLAAATLATLSPASFASSVTNQPLSITVSGTRSLLSEEMGGKSVNVITRQQISASGASNVFEALRSSGAVQITQNYTGNSNGGVVSMRGFGENTSQNVLILVNGRPLNNPTLEAPDLSIISLNNVERIEVLQGSAGVLYGQNAVGGVINIITRSIEGSSGQIQLS
uniref:TonB-dependent receptor plug domain-containing protein n=1 Tax=Neptunomonas sp. TaxID=1971898 RepID=UPI003563F37F